MSSKIVGWLVGAQDAKILELRIKSGIHNKLGINPFSLVHILSRTFQEFPGFSKIRELVLQSWQILKFCLVVGFFFFNV